MTTLESARFAETLAALDLVCPTCRRIENGQLLLASLRPDADRALACQAPSCATRYPIIDGVPVIVRDPKADIATVEAVRTALPDITLRADANMGWPNAKEAIRHIKELEPFNLETELPLVC